MLILLLTATALSAAEEDDESLLIAGVRPDRVWLAYASGYMSAPSMFGHVQLVFAGPGAEGPARIAVQYAANLGDDGLGLGETFRSLFASLPAQIEHALYYRRIRAYRGLVQRDLWEYELDLDQDGIDALIRAIHAEEAEPSGYNFLFFNCADGIYRLLQRADPAQRLPRSPATILSPLGCVRELRERGMFRDTSWTPNLQRQFELADRELDAHDRELARQFADQDPEQTGEPPHQPALTAQAAITRLQRRFYLRDITLAEYSTRLEHIIERCGSPAEPPAPPADIDPSFSHPPRAIALSGGVRGERAMISARLRLGYHALIDQPAGQVAWSGIHLLEADLDWLFADPDRDPDPDDGFTIERVDILRIESLAPSNDLAGSPAWSAAVGMRRILVREEEREPAGLVRIAGGKSLALGDHAIAYLLIGPSLLIDPPRSTHWWHAEACLGSVISTNAVGIHAEIAWRPDLGSEWQHELEAKLEARIGIAGQVDLIARGEWQRIHHADHRAASIGLRIGF